MSIHVLSAVLKSSEAKLAARLVLISIADRANDDGVAWPRSSRIQRDANVSARAVHRAITDLVELGEIEVVRPATRQEAPVYRILVGAASPARLADESPARLADEPESPARLAAVTGQLGRCHRPDWPTHREPSKEPSRETGPRCRDQDLDRADIASQVEQVGQAYAAHHPRARLTHDRKTLIRRRLRQGWAVSDLVDAIDGNHLDPHCNGENDRNREFHSLTLILRNSDTIEGYAALAQAARKNGGGDVSAAELTAWRDSHRPLQRPEEVA